MCSLLYINYTAISMLRNKKEELEGALCERQIRYGDKKV